MPFDFYNGEVLLVDKPPGWTSFQAVNKIKHAVKRHPSLLVNGQKMNAKVGHAGTLDPLATGLLIVCTGRKTKAINDFMGLEKEYTGTFFIGATTPCFDLEKPVDRTFPISHITEAMLKRAAVELTGRLQQTPPIFSAVLVDGRRAYDLARSGETPELKSREIEIKIFELTRIALPEVDFRIICSKGTYIRSMARDFGEKLGSGAHLTQLRRTRIGGFLVSDATDPAAIGAMIKTDGGE